MFFGALLVSRHGHGHVESLRLYGLVGGLTAGWNWLNLLAHLGPF